MADASKKRKKASLFFGTVKGRMSIIFAFCIKYYQGIWFIALVVMFSIFMFRGFPTQIRFESINAENVIFAVWILLLLIPLIKSIDIAGIFRLSTKGAKHDAEKLKAEKDAVVNTVNLNIGSSSAESLQEGKADEKQVNNAEVK